MDRKLLTGIFGVMESLVGTQQNLVGLLKVTTMRVDQAEGWLSNIAAVLDHTNIEETAEIRKNMNRNLDPTGPERRLIRDESARLIARFESQHEIAELLFQQIKAILSSQGESPAAD